MAIVPKVPTPSVAPRGGALNVSAPRDAFGTTGQSLERLGERVGRVSDELAVRVERQAALDNKIAVDQATIDLAQAYGQMDEDFRNNNKGIAASEQLPTLYKSIESTRQQVGASLRSPAAQQAYLSASRIATLQFTQRAASFASSEKKDYQTRQLDGQISVIEQQTGADNFAESIDAINGRLALKASPQIQGWSPEEFQAESLKVQGALAYNVIQNLAVSDPLKAQAFLDANRERMNVQQQAQASALVKSRVEPLQVAGTVDAIIAEAGAAAATGHAAPTSYRDAIASIESRGSGDYSAKGKITKSGDRAYGRYQVMGANIPRWTKEVLGKSMTPAQFLADPAAQDKVFDAKFGEAMAKYGSAEDAASVWFTGRPRSASSARAKDALGTTGADYVAKFSAAVNREGLVLTQGTGGSQVDLLESQAPAMLEKLRADPMFIGRPDLLDAAEARLMSNLGRMRSANNIANGEALGRLQLAALEGGIQDLAELQAAYPGALKDYAQLSDAGKRQLQVGLLQEANRWTPTRGARSNELYGMAGDDPAAFLKMDLSAEDITRSDREALVKKQVAIRNKDAKAAQKNAAFGKVMNNQWVQGQVRSLGLKKGDPGYWNFAGALEAKMDQWTADNPGKAPADKEIALMVGAIAKPAWEWKGGKVGGTPVRRENAAGEDALLFEPSDTDAASAKIYLRSKGLPVDEQAVSYYLTLIRDLRAEANRRGVQVSPDQFDAFIMENLGG